MMITHISAPHVLIVGQENQETKDLVAFLKQQGMKVVWAKDGEIAYNVLDAERVDALVTELRVHRIDGMRLLGIAKNRNPEVCTVLIADSPDIELAKAAIRLGAYDFLCKPLSVERVEAIIRQGIAHQRLILEPTDRAVGEEDVESLPPLTGWSPAMLKVYRTIRQVAGARTTVLICGETGTGKEMVAWAIHKQSPRKDAPFVTLNCGALPEGLVESELFGHERGAFTGAVSAHRGRFEIADGGTLFLDEVGEMTPAAQVKLLRVLQEGEFERVGGTIPRKVDVRVIAATNRDLGEAVRNGTYRADLYYRLRVVTITLPPLRERKEDIPLFIETFLREFSREHRKGNMEISRGAVQWLMAYDWPGNIRELKNCLEEMVVLSAPGRRLDVPDLPDYIRQGGGAGDDRVVFTVGMTMEEVERAVIVRTLKATGYNKQRAARMLGIGLRTLYRKGKRYQISGFL
jgi:DNA-binding NtrC family response regulator